MNAASNALGVLSALMWFGLGLYVLRRARRCEVSLRVVLGLALILVSGVTLQFVQVGGIGWIGGGLLLFCALGTALVVATKSGRRATGLSGWGITSPTQLDSHKDDPGHV